MDEESRRRGCKNTASGLHLHIYDLQDEAKALSVRSTTFHLYKLRFFFSKDTPKVHERIPVVGERERF